MIGQPRRHRRRVLDPPPRPLSLRFQTERLHRATEVVDRVFPGRLRLVHPKRLREAEPLTHSAAIHVPHCQVGPLDVGRRAAELGQDLVRIAEDHAQLRADDAATPVAPLDHLQVLPSLGRFFVGGRPMPL